MRGERTEEPDEAEDIATDQGENEKNGKCFHSRNGPRTRHEVKTFAPGPENDRASG